ncbi:MAG: ABC-type uncharacterized transport system [Oscillospiraceae bacterium]|jgi:ABC-type uncharacterized transport system involved in gliding motility auxiliary subunit|nr:ABC-type uncharacterized transport system [Oscillospiraceae bacterium]
MKNNIFKSRRFKHGSLATIVTIGLIVAVVLVNIIATILIERYPINFDLTKGGVYNLSDKTIDYMKKVDDKISIVVAQDESRFNAQGQYFTQTSELLKKYKQYGKNVSLKYVDLDKNPEIKQEFPQANAWDIIIKSDKRTKSLTVDDLFNFDTENYDANSQQLPDITSSKAEQALTGAMMFVTEKNPIKAVYLTGHNEADYTGIDGLLKANNYETSSINILTQDIDASASVVIISAPQTDYKEEQIKKLDKFLDNNGKFGKNVIYLANAEQKKLPLLESFLSKDWGITIGDGYVVETDTSKYLNYPTFTVQEYVDTAFTEALVDKEQFILIPNSRPLTATTFAESDNRKTSVLVQSYDTSVVRPSNAKDSWVPKDGKKGVYGSVVLGTRESVYDNVPVTSNVLVIGSIDALHSQLIAETQISNGEYFLNAFNKIFNKEEGLTIVPKSISTQSLSLTQSIVNLLSISFVILLPLAVLALGLIIWLRRRHL